MEVDERFSRVGKDPRYKKIAKKERKVKIDSRFEKMFTDENFHVKYSTDKRGKVIDETELEDLHKFYEIEKDDEVSNKDEVEEVAERDDSKSIGKKNKSKLKKKRKLLATVKGKDISLSKKSKLSAKRKRKSVESQESSIESQEGNTKSVNKINFDDIRGETLPADSDSDSDAESTKSNELNEYNEDDNDEVITHGWGEVDENVKCIENAETSRLAVCNCDWDKVGANDLFVLFDSFKPVNGTIKTLKIYPSEFGIERMKEEKVSGPKELRETAINDDGEDNEEGSSYNMEKLREYQLKRLKYYYAVVECDSVETANKLYEELDGKEYEMSATRMDLRFIPEDTTFDHEPMSIASGITQLKNYEPVSFHNTALQQTTVRLTWDETDTKRVQATMRQFTQDDIANMDFKDYLASSGDEEGEEEDIAENILGEMDNKINGTKATQDQRIEVYRELMQEIKAKEEKNNEKPDMEVSFKTTMDNYVSKHEDESGSEDEASDEDKGSNEDGGNEGSDEGDDIDDDESENEMSGEENINQDVNINDRNGDNTLPSDNNDENQTEGFNDPFFDNASDPNKTKSKSKKKRKKALHDSENLSESELKKKNELELLMLDESEDKKHFNLKNILEQGKSKKSRKGKKKSKDEEVDSFNIDVEDPRFSALYSSHLYALDPSEPNFKKTKATEAIIKETQKRRNENEGSNENNDNNKLDSKLSGLVNSVKSKTMLHNRKKEKKLK